MSAEDRTAPHPSGAIGSRAQPRAAAGGELVAVALAAGAGTRLQPLTYLRPKALCPVAGVPLVDHALERTRAVTDAIAVNVHHGRPALEAHLEDRDVVVSVEEPHAFETAGAIGLLRTWIAGRDVLTVNADTWHPDDLDGFVAGWDRQRVRLLTVRDPDRPDFGDLRFAGAALLPWAVARDLPAERLGLYPAVLGPHADRGALDLVESQAPYYDCGTPGEYLAANLAAIAHGEAGSVIHPTATVTGRVERSVIGAGAGIAGTVVDSVVWDGAVVDCADHLERAVRATDTVTVRCTGG